jgi:hypothetical protein
MDRAWVLEIRDQCVDARDPFFFKQWDGREKGARYLKSLSKEPEKLLVGEPGLTNDGLDDVFWQVEPFVIGHCDASGSVGMF